MLAGHEAELADRAGRWDREHSTRFSDDRRRNLGGQVVDLAANGERVGQRLLDQLDRTQPPGPGTTPTTPGPDAARAAVRDGMAGVNGRHDDTFVLHDEKRGPDGRVTEVEYRSEDHGWKYDARVRIRFGDVPDGRPLVPAGDRVTRGRFEFTANENADPAQIAETLRHVGDNIMYDREHQIPLRRRMYEDFLPAGVRIATSVGVGLLSPHGLAAGGLAGAGVGAHLLNRWAGRVHDLRANDIALNSSLAATHADDVPPEMLRQRLSDQRAPVEGVEARIRGLEDELAANPETAGQVAELRRRFGELPTGDPDLLPELDRRVTDLSDLPDGASLRRVEDTTNTYRVDFTGANGRAESFTFELGTGATDGAPVSAHRIDSDVTHALRVDPTRSPADIARGVHDWLGAEIDRAGHAPTGLPGARARWANFARESTGQALAGGASLLVGKHPHIVDDAISQGAWTANAVAGSGAKDLTDIAREGHEAVSAQSRDELTRRYFGTASEEQLAVAANDADHLINRTWDAHERLRFLESISDQLPPDQRPVLLRNGHVTRSQDPVMLGADVPEPVPPVRGDELPTDLTRALDLHSSADLPTGPGTDDGRLRLSFHDPSAGRTDPMVPGAGPMTTGPEPGSMATALDGGPQLGAHPGTEVPTQGHTAAAARSIHDLLNPPDQQPSPHDSTPADASPVDTTSTDAGPQEATAPVAVPAPFVEGPPPPHGTTPMLDSYRGEDRINLIAAKLSPHLPLDDPALTANPSTWYMDPAEREQYRIVVVDGKLHTSSGLRYDTRGDSSLSFREAHTAMYVVDERGNMYSSKGDRPGMKHSSFLAGEPVAAAGMIEVHDGEVVYVDGKSGHYRPDAPYVRQFTDLLGHQGVDMSGTHVQADWDAPADRRTTSTEPARTEPPGAEPPGTESPGNGQAGERHRASVLLDVGEPRVGGRWEPANDVERRIFEETRARCERISEIQLGNAESLTGDPKFWFAKVYHYVTTNELGMIAAGRYDDPLMKVREVVAFHETYQRNLDAWRAGNAQAEPNWSLAFAAAEGSRRPWYGPGSMGILDALLPSMQAHIRFDLPRAIAAVYETHYADSGRSLSDFAADYHRMQPVFDKASLDLLPEIKAQTGGLDPGTWQWVQRSGMKVIFNVPHERQIAWEKAELIVQGHREGIDTQPEMQSWLDAHIQRAHPLTGNASFKIDGTRVDGYDWNDQPDPDDPAGRPTGPVTPGAGTGPARPGVGTGGSGPWAGDGAVPAGAPVVAQTHDGSCVSACGEMVSGGAVDQRTLLGRLGEWSTPDALEHALNDATPGEWRHAWFFDGDTALNRAERGPMAAVLAAPGGNLHMVVIEPAEQGRFLVRDPYPGVSYEVGADWIRTYVAAGVFQ